MEKITITTEDAIELAGLWWNQGGSVSVLLLHMIPATKESWTELGNKLAAIGHNVLAIDLRGHGESGGGNYLEFIPEQHYGYFKDQTAAIAYLTQAFPSAELCLGGASIGANMTIKYMAAHHDVLKGFALSAGLDYYGVRAIDDVQKLEPSQRLLLVGARDDKRGPNSDCGQMAEQLAEASSGIAYKVVYDTGGHGTDLFSVHPDLYQDIINHLSTN